MSAQKVQEEYTKKLLKYKNIRGTAVGEKWVNGKPVGQEALLIFVQEKVVKSDIGKHSMDKLIPEEIDGVPTDIIEVGHITKQNLRSKIRPIEPGYSCGHGEATGTIGGFFYDSENTPVILSNNHVVANENNAKVGELIYQPGLADSKDKNKIGTLKKFKKLIKTDNTHDSAIVAIDKSILNSNLVKPIYPIINQGITGFGEPSVNMQVQKCGRTTGYTNGRIIGVNGTFSVEYDFGLAKFTKCVIMTSMSQGGDSGSVVLDMNMNAVGLLFAGSPKVSLANPIDIVQNYYGLKLWDVKPTEEIKIGGSGWRNFTRDGSITVNEGVLNINENANHHCFIEHVLASNTKSVECTVNVGSDQGATWGPGIVVEFPTGMLKVNLRYNGQFGGYFNDNYYLNVGKTEPNKNYRVRIRRSGNTWMGEVLDDKRWYTVVAVPDSVFGTNPRLVRLGKTGLLGSTSDHGWSESESGPVGSCSIKDLIVK